MGTLGSKLMRHARRFNVENRASRVISKAKPVPAPRHPTETKHINEVLQDKSIREELASKDPNLDDRLRQVYVVSQDPPLLKFAKPSERARAVNLPQSRQPHDDEALLGMQESVDVPPGKISLASALKMLAERQGDPEKFTVQMAADKYKLSEHNTALILKYYASFEVYIPDNVERESPAKKFLAAFKRPTLKQGAPTSKHLDIQIEDTKKLPGSSSD